MVLLRNSENVLNKRKELYRVMYYQPMELDGKLMGWVTGNAEQKVLRWEIERIGKDGPILSEQHDEGAVAQLHAKAKRQLLSLIKQARTVGYTPYTITRKGFDGFIKETELRNMK